MPELPEVETTRRSLAPYLVGHRILSVHLRRPDLHWPIPKDLPDLLSGRIVLGFRRRAKYLLLDVEPGSALLHLGMSGCLRVVEQDLPAGVHDHVDLVLESGHALRFTDPRRFGCLLWQPQGELHELLKKLGPEPLSVEFAGDYLFERSRNRTATIKTFLMDQEVVVGVGNIYAAETLFRAGIAPGREAGRVSRLRYLRLAMAVKEVLGEAIESGGTILKEIQHSNGMPKYGKNELIVYGRKGKPCVICGRPLSGERQNNRSVVWCSRCQR